MTTRTRYASYKPSGIDWLGDIPSHWDTAQLNRLASETKLGNRDMQETTVLSLSYGRIVIKNPDKKGLMPENFNTYQIVNPGNIILRLTDLQNDQTSLRVGLAKDRGIITSAYVCLNPTFHVDSRYLYQLLHSFDEGKHLYGMGSGVRQGLSYKDLRRELFPLPSLDEQRAIADYLDRKDDEITRFIESRRRMIALLEEKKQAIINQAVTRGLDPSVPMKDSGVDWLGEIPAHWETANLKRWLTVPITDGPHETPQFVDEGIDFVSADSMVKGKIDFDSRRGFITQELHEHYCQKVHPQKDDIFVCKSGATTGKLAYVDTDREFSIWSPLALVRADQTRVNPRFIFSVLAADYFQSQIQQGWSYGTQPNLSMRDLGEFVVAIPPLDIQNEIVLELGKLDTQIGASVVRYEREIELMQEYRTRLISDVVIGKVRVI